MMQHHNYSLEELENMVPWEREIYIGLLMNYLQDEKEKREKEKRKSFQENITTFLFLNIFY